MKLVALWLHQSLDGLRESVIYAHSIAQDETGYRPRDHLSVEERRGLASLIYCCESLTPMGVGLLCSLFAFSPLTRPHRPPSLAALDLIGARAEGDFAER